MSFETKGFGDVQVETGPISVNIWDDEEMDEPSVHFQIGDKTAIAAEEDGSIRLSIAVEDEDGNWGRASVSLDPDQAREAGEELVGQADAETKPMLGGFLDAPVEELEEE